jgi:hypothetical protein
VDATQAAAEVKKIYLRQHPAGHEWMFTSEVGEHTDMTPAQISAGCVWLARNDDHFTLAPESNQKVLTRMDHTYAVHFGGQEKHLISFD